MIVSFSKKMTLITNFDLVIRVKLFKVFVCLYILSFSNKGYKKSKIILD